MRLQNIAVATKLWGLVLGGMGAMLALAVLLLVFAERMDAATSARVAAVEQRLALSARWKALTELTVERVVVGPAGADIRLRVEGLAGLVRDLTAIAPAVLEAAA